MTMRRKGKGKSPGKLDQRIMVQRRIYTSDGQGGHTETWKNMYALSANLQIKGGGENYNEDQGAMKIHKSILFVIRNLQNRVPLQSDRIKHDDQFYNVDFVEPSTRNMYVEVNVSRVQQ